MAAPNYIKNIRRRRALRAWLLPALFIGGFCTAALVHLITGTL